jgi:hypothetical protein
MAGLTRRDVRLDQIEDTHEFVERFFLEQDAFDPGIVFDYFFDHDPPEFGKPGMVVNPGFVEIDGFSRERSQSTPEIERVDYLVLKRS